MTDLSNSFWNDDSQVLRHDEESSAIPIYFKFFLVFYVSVQMMTAIFLFGALLIHHETQVIELIPIALILQGISYLMFKFRHQIYILVENWCKCCCIPYFCCYHLLFGILGKFFFSFLFLFCYFLWRQDVTEFTMMLLLQILFFISSVFYMIFLDIQQLFELLEH
jgi:hypothetical protein